MPTDNSITVYSPKSGKELKVTGRAAFDAAIAKGWSKDKPKTAPLASATASEGAAPTEKAPYDPITQTGFGRGVKKGLNPFHTAPEGMAPDSSGKAWQVADDIFNVREAREMWNKGNKSGAAGLMTGTTLGLAGPDVLKGVMKTVNASSIISKGLSTAGKAEAIKRAKGTARVLGGSVKDARVAETLVQPIREALNARFEPMHKALEKQIIPLNQEAQKLIRAIAELEPEMEKEIAGLIRDTGTKTMEATTKSAEKTVTKKVGAGAKLVKKAGERASETTRETLREARTALDYREADKLVSHLRGLADKSPRIAKLADEVDKEVSTIAHAAGVGQEREMLKGLWKEMLDARNIAHDSVKQKGLVKQLVHTASPRAAALLSEGEREVSKEAIEVADKLFNKITGGSAPGAFQKALGKAGLTGSKMWKSLPPLWRAINASFQEQPEGGV